VFAVGKRAGFASTGRDLYPKCCADGRNKSIKPMFFLHK
jgi:hypothetical protein